jgi:hypothetical protein
VQGVHSDGFTIIGHPAAQPKANFRVTIAAGKFHGVTATLTPKGCHETSASIDPSARLSLLDVTNRGKSATA